MPQNYYRSIEDALKSNEPVTWLSLYRNDFSQGLPKELFQLKDLEYLSLEGTNLIHVPSELNQLENLKTLNLSWNEGLVFDKDLHLPNLESVIFSQCKLEEIPAFVFKAKRLKTINFRRNYLQKIPKELAELQNLSYLDLSFCGIEEVSEFVFELQWLNELDLSVNRIKQLPEQLGKLVLLNRLYLHKNKLESFPDSLGKLTKLEFLQLEENQLQTLPESIGDCKNLTELRASNNKITALPTSIAQCSNLKNLEISNNLITELPEDLGNISGLYSIYLGGNQLTSLPESIGNMKNLDHIAMSHNQITTLPKSFSKLVNIRSCYFVNNKFHTFPLEVLHWVQIINLIGLEQFTANRFTRRSGYRDFYKTMKVAKDPDPNAKVVAYHFFTSIAPTEPFELKACIESLKVSDKTIQENAIKHIREHHLENYTKSPLKKGAEVVLWGTVPYKRKELKEKLAEYDIKLATKVKKTTTHAIIGRKLNKYEGYDQDGLAVLTELELLAFFE
ncbi:MAG: leucine-rich repeat domain-containing protein, partial [Saprospiraceae bacterium]|nr:leucine-rich repeat domain-containing protein [Saprospiraceae bacterium]